MTELGGTLDGVGLPAIVRFLGGLNKTGCLRIVADDWRGAIFFEAGQVTGATLGSRRGLSALDALVQALPGGSFAFEADARDSGEPTIDLSREALNAHLDELAGTAANGRPQVPALDCVPHLVEQDEPGAGDEPLPLDRGTLQTLLTVDGRRTVREIVSQRATFEALWQLANLRDVGLITVTPAPTARLERTSAPSVPGAAATLAPEPTPFAPIAHCPKLGFEDDPTSSFGRPTRLHRCFAAGTPLPLSLEQQRELCLTDQMSTCPRLNSVGHSGAPEARPAAPTPARARVEPQPQAEPQGEKPRIVRLPFVARAAAERGAVADRQAVGERPEPTQFRPAGTPVRQAASSRTTPLRTRIDRAAAIAAAPTILPKTSITATPTTSKVADAAPARSTEPPAVERRGQRKSDAVDTSDPRRYGLPSRRIAGGVMGVALLGVFLFLAVPQLARLGNMLADESIDPATMPNTAALANGTPVAQLPLNRPTAALVATTSTSPAPGAASPPAQPTLPPPSTQAPTAAPQGPAILLDENFADNSRSWPSSPQSTAQFVSGSYHLSPRQIGQFVAVGAPMVDVLQDLIVSATFHKISGPSGGGYGIIVRDQAATPQNGTSQDGRYYVLEVGDKGEVGIWRRDGDHWADLLPWQPADAVKVGTAVNELTVRATGTRLSLSVNGTQVAARTDATYPSGKAGLFVGGDGNVVSVDKFSVQKL